MPWQVGNYLPMPQGEPFDFELLSRGFDLLRKEAQMETIAVTMRQRVMRGAEWLDEFGPLRWREKINLRTFDMEHPCRCVLGQVYGDYYDAIEAHPAIPGGISLSDDVSEWEIDRGFNLPDGDDTNEDWDALERAWVVHLTERGGAGWHRTVASRDARGD